jgi:hypothetical protein
LQETKEEIERKLAQKRYEKTEGCFGGFIKLDPLCMPNFKNSQSGGGGSQEVPITHFATL